MNKGDSASAVLIFAAFTVTAALFMLTQQDMGFLAMTGFAVATPTSCGEVNSDLTVAADLESNGTCFTINASDIILNCNGHSITGNGTGDLVNITGFNNITVQNCNIVDYYRAVYSYVSSNVSILNSNMSTGNISVLFEYTPNVILSGNSLISNNETGVELFNSPNSIVTENYFADSGFIHLWIHKANNTLIKNNTFDNVALALTGRMIFVQYSEYVNISNNILNGNAQQGIYLQDYSYYTTIIENLFNGTANFPFNIGSADGSVIKNNIILNGGEAGVSLSDSENVLLINNSITTGNRGMIVTAASVNISIINNTLYGYSSIGIDLSEVSNSTISGNIIQYAGDGISIESPSYGNNITSDNFLNVTQRTVYSSSVGPNYISEVRMIYKNQTSIIDWGIVNGSVGDLGSDVRFSTNVISVNATAEPLLNASANITLAFTKSCPARIFYLDEFTDNISIISATGQICNETSIPSCTNVLCGDNYVNFTVEHFDSYGVLGTNYLPNVTSILLNSTYGTNRTTENLTIYWEADDFDNDTFVNLTDWRLNGTSIAVLNMPFEGGSNSTYTKDYSSYGNNGTVYGAVWNSTDGYDGKGSYIFPGSMSNISISDNPSINISGNTITLAAWVKTGNWTKKGQIFRKLDTPSDSHAGYELFIENFGASSTMDFYMNRTHLSMAVTNLTPDTWHHFVAVANGTHNIIYFDGIKNNSIAVVGGTEVGSSAGKALEIGRASDWAGSDSSYYQFNGSLDGIRVYDRALSAEQIKLIYDAEFANHSDDTVVSQETNIRENWTVCITPNDGTEDGITVCSNDLIVSDVINITRVYPNQTNEIQNITYEENNITSIRHVNQTNMTFNITATALESSTITFSWFVNDVLKFVETIISGTMSFFSYLFNSAGIYNVTVVANASGGNDTFTFNLNASNIVPVISNVFLNSTLNTNFTDENLTVYWESTDDDNDPIVNITDWRVNGVSYARLNLPFEGGSNSTYTKDYSTNEANVIVANATWNYTAGHDGHGAYLFNGNTSYIYASMNASDFNRSMAVSVWFKTEDAGGIFGFSTVAPTGGNYDKELLVQSDGDLEFRLYPNDPYMAAETTGEDVRDGLWHHVIISRDFDSGTFLYLDGVLMTSTLAFGNETQGYDSYFTIGINSHSARYFNGTIDNLLLFNYSLSHGEVLLLNASRTDISEYKTTSSENWTACVTPNDGFQDGITVCSNNITIRNKPNIVSVYFNQTNEWQNITKEENNLSLIFNVSSSQNVTFNATITADPGTFTFSWFVNGVLEFVDVLVSAIDGFTSMFSRLFLSAGFYNITVVVNSTDSGVNDTFTFNANITCLIPSADGFVINEDNGDGITFCPGDYSLTGNITINKSDVYISCDGATLVGIKTNDAFQQVSLHSISNITIRDCVFRNFNSAISLNNVSSSYFLNNSYYNNTYGAIRIDNTVNSTVSNSTFIDGRFGVINTGHGDTNTISYNNFYNLTDTSITLVGLGPNIIENYVEGSPIGLVMYFNPYGGGTSRYNFIGRNIFKNCTTGIKMQASYVNVFEDLNISFSQRAFYFWDVPSYSAVCVNNSVINPKFANNTRDIEFAYISSEDHNNSLFINDSAGNSVKFALFGNITNLNDNLYLNSEIIAVNSTAEPGLNVTADVSLNVENCNVELLKNTGYFTSINDARDGAFTCDSCTNFVCANNIMNFTTSNFSTIFANITSYDWPMFHHDENHTGYTESSAPINMSVVATYTTGNQIQSSPAIADGYLYVGSMDHNIYQLNASNVSQLIAIFNGTSDAYSSPVVANGYVYAADYGRIYQLNASNISQQVANYTSSFIYISSPVVSDGYVYIGTSANVCYGNNINMLQLNASNISQLINAYYTGDCVYSTSSHAISSSPAVSDGYLYVGSNDHNLYKFNASNISQPIANFTTGNLIHMSSPAVANGYIYIGSTDHSLYKLNASNLVHIANFTTGSAIWSSPAVANGYVYVGSGDKKIYQLNESNLAHIANLTTNGSVTSSPAVTDKYVFVGSNVGLHNPFGLLLSGVYQLNASNISEVISEYRDNGFISSPAIANGYVYIGSVDHKLYQLGYVPSDNTPPWIFNLNTTAITSSSAELSWNATEDANGTINYGTTTSLSSNAINVSFLRFTNLTLSGLSSSSFYYFNITTCDEAGNCQVFGMFNFTTAYQAPTGGGGGGGSDICTNTWVCTNWGECINGIQTRRCTVAVLNDCVPDYPKPEEQQTCGLIEPIVEQPSLISSTITEEQVGLNLFACAEIGSSQVAASSIIQSTQDSSILSKVKQGYEILVSPFKANCEGNRMSLSLSLPDYYTNVSVLRCSNGVCKAVSLTRKEILSCGEKIAEDISRTNEYLQPDEFPLELIKAESKAGETELVSSRTKINFVGDITGKVAVDRVFGPVPEAKNPRIRIIGTPTEITLTGKISSLNVTLPYVLPNKTDELSAAVYALKDNKWTYLGGDVDIKAKVVRAEIKDPFAYSQDGKLTVSAMALVCLNCYDSKLTKEYSGTSRDAVLFIHGFENTPERFEDIINDMKLTNQPWQAWTFGYPSSKSVKENAKEMADLLQANSKEYDVMYIVAHSLGGLITQEALNYAYEQNRGKIIRPYPFVDKVAKVVSVASPNKGSIIKDAKSLFNALLNSNVAKSIFSLKSDAIGELVNGMQIPRIPRTEYLVVAGTQPFDFTALFNVNEKNDGLVALSSAQTIGNQLVNDACDNFWSMNTTHFDLLNNYDSRKIIERIISSEVANEYDKKAILGYNQYYELNIDSCSPNDQYIVVGVPVDPKARASPGLCNCGNGVCGLDETIYNCPIDCARIEAPKEAWWMILLKFRPIQYVLATLLLILIAVTLLSRRKRLPHVNKEELLNDLIIHTRIHIRTGQRYKASVSYSKFVQEYNSSPAYLKEKLKYDAQSLRNEAESKLL